MNTNVQVCVSEFLRKTDSIAKKELSRCIIAKKARKQVVLVLEFKKHSKPMLLLTNCSKPKQKGKNTIGFIVFFCILYTKNDFRWGRTAKKNHKIQWFFPNRSSLLRVLI